MKDKSHILASSELKRAEAFSKLADRHQQHKSVIQAALSNVDCTPKNKILFDDDGNSNKINGTVSVNGHSTAGTSSKKRLLESDDESDTEIDFRVKKQYEGEEGQKLLALKSKYHNDSRFILDERFIEDNANKNESTAENNNEEDEDVEVEKQKQLKILADILGKRTLEGHRKSEPNQQRMIRFDPLLPEHSKFIVTTEPSEKKTKKKKKKDSNAINENEKIEDDQPIVSKDVFYKVDASLKDVFQDDKTFSLLGTFGTVDENETEQNSTTEYRTEELNQKKGDLGANPFHYDSTDEEDETDDKKRKGKTEELPDSNENKNKEQARRWWTEAFFFEKKDYRFQEAEDFMKRIASEEQLVDYKKLRGELKVIIKHKVHHQQYKKKLLDKKLGRLKGKKKIIKNKNKNKKKGVKR